MINFLLKEYYGACRKIEGNQQLNQETPKRPAPFLSDEEIQAGDRAFVEFVKERDRRIAEVKKAKGILDGDH